MHQTMWPAHIAQLEKITNRLVPFLVLGLLVILLLDNPFWILVDLHRYETLLALFDATVLFFFVIDLIYKWQHTQEWKLFIRLYWLDVLAVMPIYLLFRSYTELARIFRGGEEITETAQKVAHETVLLRESRLIEEARMIEAQIIKEARIASRSIKIVQRMLHLLKSRSVLTFHILHHASKR